MSEGITAEQLGANLAHARKALQYRQVEIADHFGYARTTLVAIEQGKRKVSVQELEAFAAFYNVTTAWLMDSKGHVEYAEPMPTGLRYEALTQDELDIILAYRRRDGLFLLDYARMFLGRGER